MLELDPKTTALVLIDLQKGTMRHELKPYPADRVTKAGSTLAETFRKAGAPVVLVNVGFARDFKDALRQPVDQPFAAPPGGFPENFSEVIDGLAKPGDFLATKGQWGAFHARSWICNCAAAVSRQSFWEASQRTWASSRRHDRHGNTAMPSFLPKMPRAPCPRKCTTLLSATSFQGSAGSSKVLISRFLKPDSVPSMSLSTLPVFGRWGVLIALSVLFAGLLIWARFPAALLLGSMLAGILVENGGAGILVPQLPFGFAQAVVGCMIARVLTSTIIHSFLHQWPLFLGISFLVIVASCLLGWIISKLRILPETTAIWGLLPGAASAMMVMADAYGADARLVAFMQYVRVVMVAIVASIIARLWVHAPAVGAAAPEVWFAPVHALPLIETLVLVVAAVVLGPVSRIPAGTFLIPMFLGAVLQSNGLVEIELPSWLLAVSYLVLGWTIGLRFTREILVYAIRALPKMIVSI